MPGAEKPECLVKDLRCWRPSFGVWLILLKVLLGICAHWAPEHHQVSNKTSIQCRLICFAFIKEALTCMGVDQCLSLQPCVNLVFWDAEFISSLLPIFAYWCMDMILIYRYNRCCKLDLMPDSTYPAAGYVWEHADPRVHQCATQGDQGNQRSGTRQVHRAEGIRIRVCWGLHGGFFSWFQNPEVKHLLHPMIWDLFWTLDRGGISIEMFWSWKLATSSHSGFRSSPLWTCLAAASQRWRPGVCQRLLPKMITFLDYFVVA